MVTLVSDVGSDDSLNKTSMTINEIVHELKLEVDPNTSVVELVGSSGNHESILPHVSVQTLEYAQVVASQASAGVTDEAGRDPLEDVVGRSSDTL